MFGKGAVQPFKEAPSGDREQEVKAVLVELTTPSGIKFWGESFVVIDGEDRCLDDLTPEQREFAMTTVNVNALNAAFAGRAEFRAEGLRSYQDVFNN